MIQDVDSMGVIGPMALKDLLATNDIKGASIPFAPKGLIVVLKVGENERVMGLFRGGVRYFQSMDGAAAALRQNGLLQFDVDATGWTPRRTVLRGQKKEQDEE
jgi:hypothetical protein